MFNKKWWFQYKLIPREYFRKIIELYINAREPKFYNPNILRWRSISISSELEDLTALFLALNNNNDCFYYTDQHIKVEFASNKYLDILVFNKIDSFVSHLVDVKTDIWWDRKGMKDFCIQRDKRIEELKSLKFSLKTWNNKGVVE